MSFPTPTGPWTSAIVELRALLNDLNDDRYCYRKKVFGNIDGTNTTFKTFEERRLTNFTDADLSAAPLGVYVNGTRLDPSAITIDNIQTGEFTLATAPTNPSQDVGGTVVEATYYYQWFKDIELQGFLRGACRWLLLGEDYSVITSGLTQAALYYACVDAFRKMAMRYATRASNTFMLEDQPKKDALAIAESYSNIAAAFQKDATKYRDDYYTKSGQSLAAFSADNFGVISSVTPRR